MRALPAGQHIALTGTPVENRLTELWSIFQIVAPGLLGNATQFRQRFATPIEREKDPVATAELRRLTGPFLLRRTKDDKSLVPDLPDKVEQDLMAIVPEPYLTRAHHWLILHGRYTCVARRPKCEACPVADLCPSRHLFAA